MPKPKRPADVVGNAIRGAQIATGDAEEFEPEPEENPAAVGMGKLGGRKRAESMTPRAPGGDREEGGGEPLEKELEDAEEVGDLSLEALSG